MICMLIAIIIMVYIRKTCSYTYNMCGISAYNKNVKLLLHILSVNFDNLRINNIGVFKYIYIYIHTMLY